MRWNDVVSLISVVYTTDALKQRVPTETSRQVFCNIGSVTGSEFFEAGQSGVRPEFRVTMIAQEYNDEKIVAFNNKRYGVYRTYFGRNDTIELYVEEQEGLKGI